MGVFVWLNHSRQNPGVNLWKADEINFLQGVAWITSKSMPFNTFMLIPTAD